MNLLEVTDLSVSYESRGGTLLAVSNASITVAPGEIVGIVGDSGSGKSSLLLAMLGMTRPGGWISAGSVRYEGTDLTCAGSNQLSSIRGRHIGFITQHPKASFNPMVRVGAQLVSAVRRSDPSLGRSQARAKALTLFRNVGIADPERSLVAYPHELSGGMAQRALIALALAPQPRVLLADEPTSGLDVTLQAQVLDTIRDSARSVGSSLVIVTHDVGVVAQYCDRVYLMNSGEVAEEGDVRSFFSNTRHPAAIALLNSESEGTDARFRLTGLPPDRRNLPSGCYLHRRCPLSLAEAGCAHIHPELLDVGAGHKVRCHRHEEIAEMRQR